FSGSGRTQKKQIGNRPPGPAHSCQQGLIYIDELGHGFILPNDLAAQPLFKIANLRTPLLRFEYDLIHGRLDIHVSPSVPIMQFGHKNQAKKIIPSETSTLTDHFFFEYMKTLTKAAGTRC